MTSKTLWIIAGAIGALVLLAWVQRRRTAVKRTIGTQVANSVAATSNAGAVAAALTSVGGSGIPALTLGRQVLAGDTPAQLAQSIIKAPGSPPSAMSLLTGILAGGLDLLGFGNNTPTTGPVASMTLTRAPIGTTWTNTIASSGLGKIGSHAVMGGKGVG